jgi:hypothetical protein
VEIGTWRDFDSIYLCLVLNALAPVLNVLAENLDALKCGGWGIFIAPTTKVAIGEAVCRRAHRTLSSAPATSPNHWDLTVRALTSGATGQSDDVLDSHCSLSGAPSSACSNSARVVYTLFTHCSLLQTTIGAVSRCSA